MQYFVGNNSEIMAYARQRRETYANANPFPSICIDNIFLDDQLDSVIDELPDLVDCQGISNFNDSNQLKLATKGEALLGDRTRSFLYYLNSSFFLKFLSAITGIKHLIPDPYLKGGGFHQILPGGYLKIHSDFNKHPETLLDRRLNVLCTSPDKCGLWVV